jgi:hypothetical protein
LISGCKSTASSFAHLRSPFTLYPSPITINNSHPYCTYVVFLIRPAINQP